MYKIPGIKSSQTLYKINFYKKQEQSAQDTLIPLVKDNEILLHRHTTSDGRLWGITTPNNLAKICDKNRYLYEVLISNRPRKIYFDIDLLKSDNDSAPGINIENHLTECKKHILEAFPNALLQISGSITNTKISYHIVLSNWIANTVEDTYCLKNFCTKLHHLGFDNKVYTSNRNMKIVNQSKPDGRIQEIIEESYENTTVSLLTSDHKWNPTKHFITCFFDTDCKNINESNIYKEDGFNIPDFDFNKKFDITDIPQQNMDIDSTFSIYDSSIDSYTKLSKLPLNPRNHVNTLGFPSIGRIMIWSRQNDVSFEQFWQWCSKKDNCKKREKKYRNLWNKNNDWYIRESLIEAIFLRFFPNMSKCVYTRKFINQFNFHNNVILKEIDGMFLDNSCLNPDSKYTILGSPMGSNKTGTIISSLQDQNTLFITSRITLSQNICKRLREDDLIFANYHTFTTKEKENGELSKYPNVICSIESLHYLINNIFDIIVIDESESVLNTFYRNAETHRENCGTNWSFLKQFILNSKKVFLMDAFITNTTVDFINQLIKLETNTLQKIDYITTKMSTVDIMTNSRQLIQYESYNDFVNQIKQSITNGKKIFIFTCFKSDIKGVNALSNMLTSQFNMKENKNFVAYHGDKTQEKKRLYNCEKIWSDPKIKCVITNSCITIGVNFNQKNVFDEIFCLYNSFIGSRDVIQALYRIRYPNSKQMHFYHDRSYCKKEYSEAKYTHPECNIYKNLQSNLTIEDNANNYICELDTLKYFCKLANISCNWDSFITTTRQNRIEIRKIMKEANIYSTWSKINDISEIDMMIIASNICNNNETLQMRLEFEKYQFQKHFLEEHMNIAEELWNNQKQKLVYNVIDFITNPKNIIRRLYDNNEMSLTEPVKSNLILGDITIDEINANFKFQHAQTGKNVSDLSRNMINAFFGFILTIYKNPENNGYERVTINKKQYTKIVTNTQFLTYVNKIMMAIKESID